MTYQIEELEHLHRERPLSSRRACWNEGLDRTGPHETSQFLIMNELEDNEKHIARGIWYGLKYGLPEAKEHLRDVPEHIRKAVLQELVKAIDERTDQKDEKNPFC